MVTDRDWATVATQVRGPISQSEVLFTKYHFLFPSRGGRLNGIVAVWK
jgi:hypothetical protein